MANTNKAKAPERSSQKPVSPAVNFDASQHPPTIPDHVSEAPKALRKDDGIPPIQMLYSASPGLMLTLRGAPRYPTPVKNNETGMVEQVTMQSIKIKFSEDGFVPKKKTATGSGAKIIYKDLQNCGKFDFGKWFDDHSHEYNLMPEDRDKLWKNIVKGPGFGKNFGTLEMIESLLWGAEPKSRAEDKVTVIDTTLQASA